MPIAHAVAAIDDSPSPQHLGEPHFADGPGHDHQGLPVNSLALPITTRMRPRQNATPASSRLMP